MKNLKIRAKILACLVPVLIMTLILGVSTVRSSGMLADVADNYYTISVPAIESIWEARRSIQATEKYALELTAVPNRA